MNNILSTRTRIVIVATLLGFAYFFLQQAKIADTTNFIISYDVLKPIILSLICYLGSYWSLFFKVKGERFITVLLFPVIAVFSFSLFTEIIIAGIFSELGQITLIIISSVVFGLFSYILLLTVNILNASYLQDVPLGQAARAAHFIYTLLISYIDIFLLFSNQINIVVKVLVIVGLVFILTFCSLWTIKLAVQQRIVASIAISLVIALGALILSVWPIPEAYLASILSLVFYICLGIGLEMREKLNRVIWIEYLLLFVIILIFLLVFAEWGINGSIV